MAVGTGVGLIVISQTNDPLIGAGVAFILGLLSHYFFDFWPHGHLVNRRDFSKRPPLLYLDIVGGGLLFFLPIIFKFGLSPTSLIILTAIFGAQLPDVSEGLIYEKIISKTGFVKFENDLHQSTHWHGRYHDALVWNIRRDIWQIVTILLGLFFLFFS
jgi:hypothetical protein